VPDVIEVLLERGVDQALLFHRLALVGYDPDFATAYRATTFEVVEEFWYRIDDAFPANHGGIVSRGTCPPPAVTKVSYILNLDADAPAPIADTSLPLLPEGRRGVRTMSLDLVADAVGVLGGLTARAR